MLRKVNLQLVGLAGVKSARRSGDLNYPPVQLSRENYPINQVVQIHHGKQLRSRKALDIKSKYQQKRVLDWLNHSSRRRQQGEIKKT
jgi:hypothetical protein